MRLKTRKKNCFSPEAMRLKKIKKIQKQKIKEKEFQDREKSRNLAKKLKEKAKKKRAQEKELSKKLRLA